MPWPAHFDAIDIDSGTAYVRPIVIPRMIEKFDHAGQAWKFRDKYTTYVPNRRVTFKALDHLSVESESDFWTIMRACQSAKMSNPPLSFGDLFRMVFHSPRPRVSTIAMLHGRTFGGWQAALKTGEFRQRIWHYDLNKAYRWAACVGLPDMRHVYPLRRLDRWPEHGAVFVVDGVKGQLPYWYRTGLHVVTAEELPFVKGRVEIVAGVGFDDLAVDLTPSFAMLDKTFPQHAAKVSRVFWGQWNSLTGPVQESWRGEHKERAMPNPFYNPIWSALITGRIRSRLLAVAGDGLHVYVDSVLSTKELPTGPGIGQWKLIGSYRTVWVRGTGHWGSGYETLRHAGIHGPAPGAERAGKVRP